MVCVQRGRHTRRHDHVQGRSVLRPARCVLALLSATSCVSQVFSPASNAGVPQILNKTQAHVPSTVLRKWLDSLVVTIPNISTSKDGFEVDISEGNCTQMQIADISTNQKGESVEIIAQGIAATCTLHWVMKSTVIQGWVASHGTVLASMDNSVFKGTFSFDADAGKPRLPSAVQAACSSTFNVKTLKFSGSTAAKNSLILTPIITSLLSQGLGGVICKQLRAMVSPIFQKTSGHIRKILGSKATTNASWPRVGGVLVNVGQNPGLLMARQLLAKVFSNPASPNSLKNMTSKYLDRDGSISFDSNGSFLLLNKTFIIPDLAVFNISISSFALHGLDTTRLELKNSSAQQMAFGIGFEKLGVDAKIKMEIAPIGRSPLRDGALIETFDLSGLFRNFYTGASIFAAVNQTHMGTLAVNQLCSLGCVAPAVHSAVELDAAFALPSLQAALTPLSGGGLEKGVDGVLNAVLAVVLGQFAPAIDAVGNHAVAITLRDQINTEIQKYLAAPHVCPPPKETFTSPLLFTIVYYACIILCLVVGTAGPVTFIVGLMMEKKKQASDEDVVEGELRWAPQDEVLSELSELEEINEQASPGVYQQLKTISRSSSEAGSFHTRGQPLNINGQDADRRFRRNSDGSPEFEPPVPKTWECLASHPRLPWALRFGLPVLDLALICLFMASNSQVGSSVHVSLLANSQPVVQLPSAYDCSLLSSIKDMIHGGAYLLAFVVITWSGMWPYVKLLMMQWCWFVPTRVVSAHTRLSWLEFLDSWGKWSLIDVFVMVIFMVAFKFDIKTDDEVLPTIASIFNEAGVAGRFSVYVHANFGFHLFIGATLGSVGVGHVMTAMHRYAHELGEYSKAAVAGERERLCNVLKPKGDVSGFIFVWGPIVGMGSSLALVVVGIWVDAFAFNFEGVAGYILGEKRMRPFSVISLGLAIQSASPDHTESGIVFLTIVYFFFTCLVVLAYYSILIVLWCAPLSPRLHTHFFVAAQVLNGFSGLEVFVVAILVAYIEIQRFALSIVGGKCDVIDQVLVGLPFATSIPGAKTCFDVMPKLEAGFWILAIATFISSFVGRDMIARCKSALVASGDMRAHGCMPKTVC